MDQKNFLVAIVLSVAIIMGWQYVFPPKHTTPPPQETAQSAAPGTPAATPGATPPGAPAAPGSAPGAPAAGQFVSRDEALKQNPRITFSTPQLIGSISLKGGRIDDVELAKHRE